MKFTPMSWDSRYYEGSKIEVHVKLGRAVRRNSKHRYVGYAPTPAKGRDGDWWDEAACIGKDPVMWEDGRKKAAAEAVAICRRCPVRLECVLDALTIERGKPTDFRHYIRGGLKPHERKALEEMIDSLDAPLLVKVEFFLRWRDEEDG